MRWLTRRAVAHQMEAVVNMETIYPLIQQVIRAIDVEQIATKRKSELDVLSDYVQTNINNGKAVLLNFICTHNARRSQFAQLWAQVAADFYGVNAVCFSGGVEETEFSPIAVESLKRLGFTVSKKGTINPVYEVSWRTGTKPLVMFSKLYDDRVNPSANFAAIMTCADANENCPLIAGGDKRIALNHEDPKRYDNTPLAPAFYDYCSFKIATELFYVFSNIRKV